MLELDVTDEETLSRAGEAVGRETAELQLIINVAGVLHRPDFGREKKLSQVRPEVLRSVFEVNAS